MSIVHCPLSIVDLRFFRNVLLRSVGQFSLNSFTRFHSLFYLHVAYGVRVVFLNPSIHTEVIDKEVYTPSGVKISLLQAKAQKAKCKYKKTSVKSFADPAYSICFLSLFVLNSAGTS